MREIGRRCLLTSVTGFCLGIGTASAIFHDDGYLSLSKVLLESKLSNE